ncbi:MAG: GNAT family N-acetyltransferase [Anaerolineae bacterium]
MDKKLLDLPTALETQRLIVRRYVPGDAPAYLGMCRDNRDHLLPYEAENPVRGVETLEQAEALVREFYDGWNARTVFFFGAWEKDSGAFAAQIYLGVDNWRLPEFILGYFADHAHEGRGFVTEAARAVLGFTFGHLRARRVRLWCHETNTRSWRVAERLGFVREGYLRETNNWILLPDGGLSGDYVYGLLRREFEA